MKKLNFIFASGGSPDAMKPENNDRRFCVIETPKKRRPTTPQALRAARRVLQQIADNHGGAAAAVRALEATKNPTPVDTAALRRMAVKFTGPQADDSYLGSVLDIGPAAANRIINQFIDYLKANTK